MSRLRSRAALPAVGLGSLLLMAAEMAAAQGAAAPTPAVATPSTSARTRNEVSSQSVEQKTTMVSKLLFNSPLASRITGSQDEHARKHFANARELYSHAKSLSEGGLVRGADALLNEAIYEIGRAQQLAPDPTVRLIEERARYQQLADSADALLRTYAVDRGAAAPPPERSAIATKAAASVAQAKTLANAEKLVDANRALEQALGLLLKDALTGLDGQTLVYDRRFASSKDEYAFEVERLRSYEQLVPLALLEFRPSKEASALIDRYVKQGRAMVEKAEMQAAAGDHAAGIRSLNEGTDALQRALQAAGLSVPQTMGSP